MALRNKLLEFRERKGLSHLELANILGVGKVTVLRWENGTSKPSPLASEKLTTLGLAPLKRHETKSVSIPRLSQCKRNPAFLRRSVPESLSIGTKSYTFTPSPYVVNGPEDQLAFFNQIYKLQEHHSNTFSTEEYARRLSLVNTLPELGVATAQSSLESVRLNSTHWNPNYGPHGWHRYVGRFPPHLVRALINHFAARRGELVCDPFAGSGTTLVEARLLGMKGLGVEICPLSSLITRVKSQFPNRTEGLQRLLRRFQEFYDERWQSCLSGCKSKDLTHQHVIERKGNRIPPFPNNTSWFIPEAFLGTSIAVEFINSLRGYQRDFMSCALSSRMRSIGNVDVDVVRAEYSRKPRSEVNVLALVTRAIQRMINGIEDSIKTHRGLLSEPQDIVIDEGSVLDADIPAGEVDYIITSPPYGVESLSYLRTHLLSYRSLDSILGHDPYTNDAKIIGSEYMDEDNSYAENWTPSSISKTFHRFFSEGLKSEVSTKVLRRKTMMMRFFADLMTVSTLFSKWLRPGGRVGFIIGNKRIGDHVIPTSTIVKELFEASGLRLDQSIQHKLKCNNSNSEVPWQERIIQDEYVLLFTKARAR